MSIYRGSVEELLEYALTGAKVAVPTTSSTLACDLDQWRRTGCPAALAEMQGRAVEAHRSLGILGTYTCTPQFLGFAPPKGARIVSVESSAIIYFNSVLGARTNRGGFLTRYSAVCGKYPLMGYLLDGNRRGTHLFRCRLDARDLESPTDWSALGFHAGKIAGSEVPVFADLPRPTHLDLLALGAALATSGSVTLFHAPPWTAEADTVEQAFGGRAPKETVEVARADLDAAYDALTTIPPGGAVDFVSLGCPHLTLDGIRGIAEWFRGRGARVAEGVRLWCNTNRMTKGAAAWEGAVAVIEAAGGLVVADSCPVESHMRLSTCREHGLATPQVAAMVTDSAKMARYVGDLIGCRTALASRERCLESAVAGRYGGR
jgi:predicted aconitase